MKLLQCYRKRTFTTSISMGLNSLYIFFISNLKLFPVKSTL